MKILIVFSFLIMISGCDRDAFIGPSWHSDYEKQDGIIVVGQTHIHAKGDECA